ncbi:hypothetical protein S40293_00897 [Stachybotrys chartarum IBT 40293]|nr:hypothetical protein S40293_00897 [Stachybotrys chartarum IBT 40293]
MTSAGGPHVAASQDAASTALKGASLAFQKKKPAPPPANKDNGALTAATQVGTGRRQHASPPPPPSAARQLGTGGQHPTAATTRAPSTHSASHVAASNSSGNSGNEADGGASTGLRPLQVPAGHGGTQSRVDPKSPSFIAATLAASRSASPSPRPRGTLRRKESDGPPGAGTGGNDTSAPVVVDSGSIAPTGSLISMFERGKVDRTGDPAKRASPRRPSADSRESIAGELQERTDRTRAADPVPAFNPATRRLNPPYANAERTTTAAKLEERSASSVQAVPSAPKPKPQPKARPETPPPMMATQPTIELSSPKPKPNPKPKALYPPASISQGPAGGKSVSLGSKPKPALQIPREVVTRSSPEVVSPKPTRPARGSLDNGSARLAGIHTAKAQLQQPPILSDARVSAKRPPTPPKPRGSQRKTTSQSNGQSDLSKSALLRRRSLDSISSDDTFVSASSVQSPERRPSPLPAQARPTQTRRHSTISAPASPTRAPSRLGRPSNASASNLPLNSLTNAIVAGSLASARLTPHNTGSTLAAPSLPNRQKSPHLRPTLRQPPSASDEESDRHRKGPLRKFQKGKHAHNEGSRKRWREQMTQRERKRYEAVWASNRGLLVPQQKGPPPDQGDGSQCVANVVVREIWKRSRLPEDELAEVWDLVDRTRRGVLDRQEFVVGMWLIDQRLRGRKIPIRVSDSVWGSANGVQVVKPKVRR